MTSRVRVLGRGAPLIQSASRRNGAQSYEPGRMRESQHDTPMQDALLFNVGLFNIEHSGWRHTEL
jgi:hypothetical protein